MSAKSTALVAVKETLVGAEETPELSSQTKARFNAAAVKDAQTGELFMGPEEFINAVAPVGEDYHKVQREQYGILFNVADRKGRGKISLSDWAYFENILAKPDAEYEIAFRLFDVERIGSVQYDNFKKLYELNKGENSIPFNWDCEWAKLYIGAKKNRHAMDYPQFSQMLRGLQGERIRQAFQMFDKDGDGYIEPEDFERIILETSRHKLSDHVLDNLSSLCNISLGSKISYANVRAFQNMIKEMDLVELIVRRACAKSTDGKITRAEFLNQAAATTRFILFTPMEADILFHFASQDAPSGRLSLKDFAKVLDPAWRGFSTDGEKTVVPKTKWQEFTSGAAESTFNFALGSIAGAFGAFMVYPIDLVKTRLQNQRSVTPGQQLYKNSIDCFQKVVRNEGFLGLYGGVGPQLIGVAPEKAIKLTVNDMVRNHFISKDPQKKLKVWQEILAGGSAGGCQVVFTNPLEIVKIRLQIQGEMLKKTGAEAAKGVEKRSAMWIIRNLGVLGLYKGATACLLRDVPFSMIYFPTYAHLKTDFFGESPTKKLGVLQLLTAGAIAGMPAAYLTTPCDVIKTRLQVEKRDGETHYKNVRHAATTIMKEEGLKAFFKGGPARIFRSSPQFGFTLAAYEFLKGAIPYPGGAIKNTVTEKMATLTEKRGTDRPFDRSRNALKTILDLDENFGRMNGAIHKPNQEAWKSLPTFMGGNGGAAAALKKN